MDCEEKIKVQTLSKEEAWGLFMDKLRCEVPFPPILKEIAESIVRECAGLPLGIITMAGSLKEIDDVCEWRNMLRELIEQKIRQDDMEDEVFKVLKFSYYRLNDPPLQQCFLYCALFPEDFHINREELIEYLIVEGIIEGMSSRQAQFDKGHVMLNKLQNVCLLEGITKSRDIKYVKMHDLFRDMALQMMKSGPLAAIVEAGKELEEITNEVNNWSEDLRRVTLIGNRIKTISSTHSPRCPNLSTLLLCENVYLVLISDSFFYHLHHLKVLDLSNTNIHQLPASVGSLENLTALLLKGCSNLTNVPSLARLKALKKLDFSHTNLSRVPEGMQLLSNLSYLNLFRTKLKRLPAGILPKFFHLQFLGFEWMLEASKLRLKELACLQKLETLICRFHDYDSYIHLLSVMDCRVREQRLSKYYLLIGSDQFLSNDVFYQGMFGPNYREVHFAGSTSKEVVLPKDTQMLRISYGLIGYGRGLCLRNAIKLKYLKLEMCSTVDCLFYLSSSRCIFQTLESVKLYYLENLCVLFSEEGYVAPPTIMAQLPDGAFSNLKIFKIRECHRMKKLFPPALSTNLQNLEKLEVWFCSQMEEIIAAEEQEDGSSGSSSSSSNHSILTESQFHLPKLRFLALTELPKLKSICSGKMICKSLQKVGIQNCQELKNIPLSLPLSCLQEIRVYPEEWWELVNWDHSTNKSGFEYICTFDAFPFIS